MALLLSFNQSVGQATDDPTRVEILQNVRTLIEQFDSYKAIDFIQSRGEPETVAKIYSDLVLDFYWKKHDLPSTIVFARAGIQYCLSESERIKNDEPDQALELKSTAKAISYNLASFTWPGWDEKGINISHTDILTGLDAARLNLRLARELDRDDLQISMAYWMLGAQLLAVQKYDEAINAFNSEKDYAHSAGDRLNELLADGYIGVAAIVAGDEEGKKQLGQAIERLNEIGSGDARFFVDQFNTALNVFIK